ncbi:uncharacterized protein LOC135151718 [Daucus carota subsp. sativus]|uniref:uncharacterized protein LOC135151718 n=2 Tax=Daucus carota subsp. sativus TaxID=79200 RepID=UPI0030828090
MERNNNSVKGQQAGLSGVGKIDQNGGGNNHMGAVAADGGRSGIAATGSNNEKQIDASEAYSEQFDLSEIDELTQVEGWVNDDEEETAAIQAENVALQAQIAALRAENDRLRAKRQKFRDEIWRDSSFKDFVQFDLLGTDVLDQVMGHWLKNENTKLKETNDALRRQLLNDNQPNCACGCEDGGEDSEDDNGGH